MPTNVLEAPVRPIMTARGRLPHIMLSSKSVTKGRKRRLARDSMSGHASGLLTNLVGCASVAHDPKRHDDRKEPGDMKDDNDSFYQWEFPGEKCVED
jgi:hypothetical protein